MDRGLLEDRLAIRELIETFAVGAMRIDVEYWANTWAEAGIWKLSSMPEPVRGKSKIVATFRERMAYVDYLSMFSFPADLAIDGSQARGKAYCREIVYPKNGGKISVVGCYDDEYVKQDGRWYFLSRFYEVLGMEK